MFSVPRSPQQSGWLGAHNMTSQVQGLPHTQKQILDPCRREHLPSTCSAREVGSRKAPVADGGLCCVPEGGASSRCHAWACCGGASVDVPWTRVNECSRFSRVPARADVTMSAMVRPFSWPRWSIVVRVPTSHGRSMPSKLAHTDVGWCGAAVCADASDRSHGHQVGLRRDSCEGVNVGEQAFAGLVATLDGTLARCDVTTASGNTSRKPAVRSSASGFMTSR